MLYSNSAYEQVFNELKEKMKYGAPELKSLYQKFLTKGLLVAIIIHAVFISGYFYSLSLNDANAEEDSKERIFIFEDYNFKQEEENRKLNIEPPAQVKIKDLSSLIPDPVRRNDVKEKIKVSTQDELEDIKLPTGSEENEGISDINGVPENTGKLDGVKIDETIEKIPVKEDLQIFEVDKAPVAVNLNSVKSSLKYPEVARRTETEGKIVVKVLVGKDGSVMRVKRFSGPDVFYDEVSEKVMALKFTQALVKNEPVNCWVNVPFNFILTSKDKTDSEDQGDN